MAGSSATATIAVHRPPARGKTRVPWLYALHPEHDTRVAFAIPATDVHEGRSTSETPHDHRKRAEHQHQPSLPVLCPTSLPRDDAAYVSACPPAGGDGERATESTPRCSLMHADLSRAKQTRIHTAGDSPPPFRRPGVLTQHTAAPLRADSIEGPIEHASPVRELTGPPSDDGGSDVADSTTCQPGEGETAAEERVSVHLPNDVDGGGPSETLLASTCLPTKSLPLDDDGSRRVGPLPLSHCAHWLNRRMCVYGPSCRFVHCVKGTTLPYPPPPPPLPATTAAAESTDDAANVATHAPPPTGHGAWGVTRASPTFVGADTTVRVGVLTAPVGTTGGPPGGAAPAAVENRRVSPVLAQEQPSAPLAAAPPRQGASKTMPPLQQQAVGVAMYGIPYTTPFAPDYHHHHDPTRFHFAASPADATPQAAMQPPLVQQQQHYHIPQQQQPYHGALPPPLPWWQPHTLTSGTPSAALAGHVPPPPFLPSGGGAAPPCGWPTQPNPWAPPPPMLPHASMPYAPPHPSLLSLAAAPTPPGA